MTEFIFVFDCSRGLIIMIRSCGSKLKINKRNENLGVRTRYGVIRMRSNVVRRKGSNELPKRSHWPLFMVFWRSLKARAQTRWFSHPNEVPRICLFRLPLCFWTLILMSSRAMVSPDWAKRDFWCFYKGLFSSFRFICARRIKREGWVFHHCYAFLHLSLP